MFGNSLNKNFKTSFQPSFALIPHPVRLSGSFFAFLCPTRGILSLGDVNMPRRPPHSKFSSRLFLNFLSPDIHSQVAPLCSKKRRWRTQNLGKRRSLHRGHHLNKTVPYWIWMRSQAVLTTDCWMWPDCDFLSISLKLSYMLIFKNQISYLSSNFQLLTKEILFSVFTAQLLLLRKGFLVKLL